MSSLSTRNVIIHVQSDDGSKKDFKCPVQLFLLHMRYFRPYFENIDSSRDVDISVRCDIDTFDWLLR